MLSMHDIGIILSPGYRSRAYLQVLISKNILPSIAILLPGDEPNWIGEPVIHVDLFDNEEITTFLPDKSLRATIQEAGIKVVEPPSGDVNSEEFISFLSKMKQTVLIYSGPAGCILKPAIFKIGKRFLHAHGGEAPQYSGSTAFYYSILIENSLGATVFWMDEGLDTGEVLVRNRCHPPLSVDIDCIVDPLLRADAMATALKGLVSGSIKSKVQDHTKRCVYYVIHPLLKHIALRKCGLVTKQSK